MIYDPIQRKQGIGACLDFPQKTAAQQYDIYRERLTQATTHKKI